MRRVPIGYGGTAAIGDHVGFKCDVEQYGEVVAITVRSNGFYDLVLEGNFEGGYIGGETRTTMDARDCWKDD